MFTRLRFVHGQSSGHYYRKPDAARPRRLRYLNRNVRFCQATKMWRYSANVTVCYGRIAGHCDAKVTESHGTGSEQTHHPNMLSEGVLRPLTAVFATFHSDAGKEPPGAGLPTRRFFTPQFTTGAVFFGSACFSCGGREVDFESTMRTRRHVAVTINTPAVFSSRVTFSAVMSILSYHHNVVVIAKGMRDSCSLRNCE